MLTLGENRAVKEIGYRLMLRHADKTAVERRGRDKSEPHRENHAQRSDDKRRNAAGFELFQVGFKPGGEHDEYDADFCKKGESFQRRVRENGLIGDIFNKAERNAGKKHTDHLRKPYFFADYGKKLGAEQNQPEWKKYLEIGNRRYCLNKHTQSLTMIFLSTMLYAFENNSSSG